MNWDDLRLFLAVARTESLAGAGRFLKLDPATVGRRIARLERELGEALFLKSPQGYALTAAGERLLPRAAEAEGALMGIGEELHGRDSLSGVVRIGAPDGCANFLLPQVTAQLREAHPGLEMQVVALPRVFNLSKREADLAVAVSRPEAGRLSVRKIADYRLHLAASEDYLAKHPPIAALDDLKAHSVVGYVSDVIFDSELDYLDRAGIDHVDLASNSVSVQGRWIGSGGGIGIVHDFMLPFMPGVRKVLPDALSLSRTFWLVRHSDDRSARIGLIADLLTEGMRAEIARLEGRA